MGAAVDYVRNVEEVRGHLRSSATLLERGRQSGATLHAGHGADYFAAVLPPLRDQNPELATRLRARLNEVPGRVASEDAGAFESFLAEEVSPLLDRAVGTVVSDDLQGSAELDARVRSALAGRIAEEYDAAVTADGDIELAGEYWDGRGFLTRIEQRSDGDDETLARLRSEMEAVEPPATVTGTTLELRIETAATLPSATVESREEALTYVRSAEEIRGHLLSSVELAAVGSADAGLHAAHGSDYLLTVLPPVQRADPDLATRLFDRIRALDDEVRSSDAAAYERYVTEDVLPLVDEAVATAVPGGVTERTSFDAAVVLALADRVAEEYAAAVPEGEAIELYGEYWDARGFLSRMEARFAEMEAALDSETAVRVEEELDVLRTELETARPAWDVENSVAALHDALDDVAVAAA